MFIIYWNELSLPTDKLHRKTEAKILTNFPANFVGRFYRKLANNVDSAVNSHFYGRNDNDTEDVKKSLLASSDFTKGIQDDIHLYITHDRPNNASLRKRLDPISKNVILRQNSLELVFVCFRTFDAQNSVVSFLLRELDIGKKDIASDLLGKVPRLGLPLGK